MIYACAVERRIHRANERKREKKKKKKEKNGVSWTSSGPWAEAHQVGETIALTVRRGEGGEEKDVQELKISFKLEAAAEGKL